VLATGVGLGALCVVTAAVLPAAVAAAAAAAAAIADIELRAQGRESHSDSSSRSSSSIWMELGWGEAAAGSTEGPYGSIQSHGGVASAGGQSSNQTDLQP
jgi:archaellin